MKGCLVLSELCPGSAGLPPPYIRLTSAQNSYFTCFISITGFAQHSHLNFWSVGLSFTLAGILELILSG